MTTSALTQQRSPLCPQATGELSRVTNASWKVHGPIYSRLIKDEVSRLAGTSDIRQPLSPPADAPAWDGAALLAATSAGGLSGFVDAVLGDELVGLDEAEQVLLARPAAAKEGSVFD